MSTPHIQSETFAFLRDLEQNNYREWFQEHKARYQAAHENVMLAHAGHDFFCHRNDI
ncbi:MAG: DUF2461 family protein, partial [Bacteroidota bacterium]